MATTDVLAGTPFSINTLPIKASPTPKPAPAPTVAPDLEAQELEAYKQKGQLAALKDEAVLKKEKETAEAQAKTTADYAKAVTEDPTRKLLGEKVKERADTTFVPSKETAQDMGLLFTLTNIVGFMIGGKSKGNAQQAMSAMNGMLEGHQKGREDLYKKEKAIFEENSKALDKTIEALDRQFKEVMQIYAVDKEAGMAKAQSAIAEHNATFLGDALKKNGLAYSADLLSKAVAQKDKKELAMQTLKNREEDIKRQERHQNELLALRQRELNIKESKTGGAGTDRYGFGDIMATASNEAAASVRNIMGLPIESTSGIFGGKQTNSLFTAPVDAFANTMTSESAQRYNSEAGKLSYNLSQLMKGGRAVGVNEVAVMDNILKIKEGDTLETASTKLAEARQIAERAMEVRIKSPNTPKELKEVYKENLQTVRNVIPFTVDDINKFVQAKNKKETFGEVLKNKYQEPTEDHPDDIKALLKQYGGK